jgi:hypothetical protein
MFVFQRDHLGFAPLFVRLGLSFSQGANQEKNSSLYTVSDNHDFISGVPNKGDRESGHRRTLYFKRVISQVSYRVPHIFLLL